MICHVAPRDSFGSSVLTFIPGLVTATLVMCVLSSCSSLIKKEYKDPKKEITEEVAPKSKWVQEKRNGEFVIKRDWWKAMGDPELDRLIWEATSKNIDLRLLVNRVKKAELELGDAKRNRWPKLSATAGYTGTRTMNHSRTTGTTTNETTAESTLSWELDMWGKLKQKKEAQWSEFRATEADWRAGYLGMVASLSRAYFAIRRLDEQQGLHKASLKMAEESLDKYKLRAKEGLENEAKVDQQKAEVLRLKRELLELNRQRKVRVNELALILGKAAGSFKVKENPLRKTLKQIKFPSEINANLLERRPDIVAAELRVKKAYHLQEHQRAARMPSISIGLSTNLTSAAINTLTQNWTASFLPKIEFPGLDPSTKFRLKIKEVELADAREQYKRAVLKAIREVEDALINLRNRHEQMKLETERVENLKKVQMRNQLKQKEGLISQLALFETERTLLQAQQKGLELYGQLLQDTVTLYNALGGGWE